MFMFVGNIYIYIYIYFFFLHVFSAGAGSREHLSQVLVPLEHTASCKLGRHLDLAVVLPRACMAPAAFERVALAHHGVRAVTRPLISRYRAHKAWLSHKLVEGFLIASGQNVALAFATAEVCSVQLQMVDARLRGLL